MGVGLWAPEELRTEIAEEESCAAQLPTCRCCGQHFPTGEDVLMTHAWAKAECRAGLSDAQRAQVEEWVESAGEYDAEAYGEVDDYVDVGRG